MIRRHPFLSGLASFFAALMLWGLWHVWTHAALDIQVHDYALAEKYTLYGWPTGVRLELSDRNHARLAVARTTDSSTVVTAMHPRLGDCRIRRAEDAESYGACFSTYSRWISGWAGDTRFVTFAQGKCVIRDIPVEPVHSKQGWATWWFPLAHGSGKPFEYIQLVVKVNTLTCTRID